MLKLSGKTIEIKEIKNSGGVFSISTDKNLPDVLRLKKIYFITENQIPSNYYHYFVVLYY